MKTIIKHGETKFRTICPICGCEFEYTYEDIQTVSDPNSITCGATVKVVECPECKEKLGHNNYIYPTAPVHPTWPTYPWPSIPTYPNYPHITWEPPYVGGWDGDQPYDCNKCINKPDPNKIVVGDTPCTWCPKMQPHCISSASTDYTLNSGSYTFQYTNPTVSIKTEKDDDK